MDKKNVHNRLIAKCQNGVNYYITKNHYGAWVAYIDVTEFQELKFKDTDEADRYRIPFHGGCTFCDRTARLFNIKLKTARFLLGCDWNHDYKSTFGVEKAKLQEVEDNIKDVIRFLPVVRLRRQIEGY